MKEKLLALLFSSTVKETFHCNKAEDPSCTFCGDSIIHDKESVEKKIEIFSAH